MADIASLGIKVTTQGAKEAAADLDKLQVSGDKAATATQTTSKAFSGTAKTARELQFATRGLPAQFTDIATSLASGQKPMLVFLQQGGQIKDIFGGVGPALRAMGGYVMGLINPLTLAAAAIAAVGFAWKNAEDEASAFNKAIVLTGNNADLTVERLRQMAAQIDATTNATAGGASDALAMVAGTGKFTAEQIGLVAKAAVQMKDATGKAIEDTVKEFVSLKGDPVEAILKLNESQHFLTEETLKTIRSFQEQGREADAAAVAVRAYADTINDRTPEVVRNLSLSAKVWRDIKSAVLEAGDSVSDFFRQSGEATQAFIRNHETAMKALARLQSFPLLPFSGASAFITNSAINNARQSGPQNSGGINVAGAIGSFGFNATDGKGVVDSAQARARIDAEKEFGRIVTGHLSEAKRLEAEITRIRETGKKAGASQAAIEEQVAAARAAAAKSGGGGGGGRVRSSGAARALPDFTKNAGEDLAKLAEQEDRATQSFLDMAATLSGPLAEAQRDHQKRVQELNELAEQSPIAAAGLTKALEDEAARHKKVTDEINAQLTPYQALLAEKENDLRLMGLQGVARDLEIDRQRLGRDLTIEETAALREKNKALEDGARAADLQQKFQDSLSDSIYDFVTGAKSATDAAKGFFNSIAQYITRMIAENWSKKIGDMFSGQSASGGQGGGTNWFSSIIGLFGGGSANGNAFVNGSTVQAFANGGIVNSPTMFGMSGGRFGVMGENNKPEAILPLHRGPDGKLGVRMEAANDDRRAVVNNVTTFVLPQTMTPQTQAQIAQGQQRAASRATSRNR